MALWSMEGNEIRKMMSIMILLSVSGTGQLKSVSATQPVMSGSSLGPVVIRTRKYPVPTLRYYVLPLPYPACART